MSQIRCGNLKRLDKGDGLGGAVQLGSRLDGAIYLTKSTRERTGDNSPDYDVSYQPKGGSTRLVGAAWIKNHPNVGDFLTLSLDDPDWTSPLNLTAFPPDKSDGAWQLVWSRPRGSRVQSEGEGTAQ